MQQLRDVLLLQKRELDNLYQKKYIPRDTELPELNKDVIKIIIGPRRAGKSFFSIFSLKKLPTFGYVNFDDENLTKIKDYNEIIDLLKDIYQDPQTLFLDEIQNIPQWELLVNRLQRQGFNLIITGSNSKLLSRELSTHLTGRYIQTIIFPFSFKEYLKFFDQELTKNEIKIKLDHYCHKGGFPEPLVKELNYSDYLRTLFDSVIYKDIVHRYKIRSVPSLDKLAGYLITNTGNPVSYQNLTRMTGLKSVHTIEKYLRYLEEAFLLFQVNAFSFKVKEQIKSKKKIYIIDNGFIQAKSFQFSQNTGWLYENLVALELKKREYRGDLEFYYYKTRQNYEIDFLIKQGSAIKQLIQVCFQMNEKSITRGIRALLQASQETKCNNLLIITRDMDKTEEVEWFNIKGKIKFIPLYKWLLNPNI